MSFTSKTEGMENMNYHERIKKTLIIQSRKKRRKTYDDLCMATYRSK